MESVELDPRLPRVFPLVFGCSSLGSRYARAESLRALSCAADNGVQVFDTARSYGYGESEAIIGSFLKQSRPKNVVVCTKAGIQVPRSSLARGFAKAIARKVFSFAPSLRNRAKDVLGKQHQDNLFGPQEVVESVHQSLRALMVDRIDVLFLHDVGYEAALKDDLWEALERLRSQGKLLLIGPSSKAQVLLELKEAKSRAYEVVQFHAGLHEWSAWPKEVFSKAMAGEAFGRRGVLRFGNQPFGGGNDLQGAREHGGPELFLRAPLVMGICDLVVTSMMKSEHIRQNVRFLRQPQLSAADVRLAVENLVDNQV